MRRPVILIAVFSLGFGAIATRALAVEDPSRDLSAAGSLSFEIRPLQIAVGLQRQPAFAATAGLPGLENIFAPDSALPVAPPAAPQPGQVSGIGRNARVPLYQSGCSICMSGSNSVQWNGGSASFSIPQITNNRSGGTSGSLRAEYVVTSTYPVYGSTINSYQFTGYDAFSPLQGGYYYAASTSGTVASYQDAIPAGTYWVVIELLEYSGSGWVYDDFGVDSSQVSCNGVSGCSVIAACVEDAYTMCLGGGRYKVTSRWQNQ